MTVNLVGLDPEKCRQRNRLAALRFGVETATLRLSSALPDTKLEFARGKVPTDPEEALHLINELRPPGSPEMTLEDIYILPTMESANSNFVGDRYLFLGTSTLRNIQREAGYGFAFMNSHRTGDFSTPSELPFGRTFAGRYERYASVDDVQEPFQRTQLGVYMLRKAHPNGLQGPSTDTMYRQIVSGVLNDVSMGLRGGDRMCDICGNELRSEDCSHFPGTSHKVSKEQSSRQKARGVKKGYASYTLEDAHSGEVSGVYDGAIPGAGFSKAMEGVKLGIFSPVELIQLSSSYSSLLRKGELGIMDDIPQLKEAQESFIDRILQRLHGEKAEQQGGQDHAPSPDVEKLLAESKAKDERLAQYERIEGERRVALAKETVSTFFKDKQLLPLAVNAGEALATMLADTGNPLPEIVEYADAMGKPRRVTPLQLLQDVFAGVPQHNLLTDHKLAEAPKGAFLLRASDSDLKEERFAAEAKEDVKRINGSNAGKASKNGHDK